MTVVQDRRYSNENEDKSITVDTNCRERGYRDDSPSVRSKDNADAKSLVLQDLDEIIIPQSIQTEEKKFTLLIESDDDDDSNSEST